MGGGISVREVINLIRDVESPRVAILAFSSTDAPPAVAAVAAAAAANCKSATGGPEMSDQAAAQRTERRYGVRETRGAIMIHP